MPPPPAEESAAAAPAPIQEESKAPAEEQPVKVAKKKGSKGSEKVTAGTSKYSVKKGESLWRIAGKDSVYGDSFKWPLLFKANRANIDDPDLIYPRQALKISKKFNADEEADAVGKAKETPPYEPHSEPRKKLPIKY
jgi:nucleoid-associated protein YgaU